MDMRMRRCKIIVSVVLALIAVALVAVLYWPLSQPFELKVERIEPAEMRDAYGDTVLVTFGIRNRTGANAGFEDTHRLQVQIARRWIELERPIRFGGVAARQKTEDVVAIPAIADACRLNLNYGFEPWRSRLMTRLGPKGRTLLAKSPLWVRKWLWPNPYKQTLKPPFWKQTTLEVTFPQKELRRGLISTMDSR
jgi:hypothetical protein